jgi:xylulokinase
MDAGTGDWSDELLALTGVRRALLPPIRDPLDVIGPLAPEAAGALGLPAGLPVLAGAGDYPAALLGSGAMAPGMASDVTGTSTIVTLLHAAPVIDAEVSNVATVEGNWGSLTLLDAGGDAVRWARRAFHENRRGYDEASAAAARAAAGAGGLFFLPYLSGERFGAHRNSRAQFFGLTASHGLPELHRAVLEGVAFSVRRALGALQGDAARPERFVAAGGGARSELWLRIKASMYGVPYLVPREPECGVVGAAAMMAAAVGDAPDLAAAVGRMVAFEREVAPEPGWAARYDRMMPVYERLYRSAQGFYDDLDALAEP